MPIFKRTISDELIKATFYLSRSDKAKLKKQFLLRKCSCWTVSKDRGAYSNHPINVALICAGWKLDVEALVAGLLHDTVEDTATSLIVFLTFMVTRLLNLLMDYQKLTNWFTEVSKKNCGKFPKNVIGNGSRCKSILIKLADRLHNMQTLSALSKKKRRISKKL